MEDIRYQLTYYDYKFDTSDFHLFVEVALAIQQFIEENDKK